MAPLRLNIIFFFLVSLGFTGCSILDGDSERFQIKEITGQWEWVHSATGWAAVTPETAGYTREFIYYPDGTFSYYQSGTLTVFGKYTTELDQEIKTLSYDVESENMPPLLFSEQLVEFITSDTLKLYPRNCFDCSTRTYNRISGMTIMDHFRLKENPVANPE